MEGITQRCLAFVKTVEYGSFTKAAYALGYAQSSVSKMISDLEGEWGMALLKRSRAGVELTSDGVSMLPYARELVECCVRVQEHAAELKGLETGTIRIGTFSSVATHWMPNIIKAFQKDYPKVEYELLTGDYDEIERWILEGRVECGFLRLPIKSGLDTVFLERDELVLVLPENHELCREGKIAPRELDGVPFMLLEHGGKTEVSEFLEKYGVRPDLRFTSWDDYSILSMVENGFGAAILPRLILKRIPYKVSIRSFSEEAFRDIVFAFPKGAAASRTVRKFRDYLGFRYGSTASDKPSKEFG